jgi:uncharacterized protein involved in cysteine biosynthesis
MIRSLARAASQLPDPPLRRLLLASLGLAAACFVVLLAALWFALPWVGALLPASAPQWLRTTIEFVAGAGAVVLSIVLFPGVVMAIQSGLMTERICAAVEARHYPGLPAARSQPVGEAVAMALRFLGATIALNLLVLPLYFVPLVNVVAFAAVNGYLVARESFEAVAPRRLDAAGMDRLWRARRARFWAAGAALALVMAVPVLNLAGALLAAAAMTHLVEEARRAA